MRKTKKWLWEIQRDTCFAQVQDFFRECFFTFSFHRLHKETHRKPQLWKLWNLQMYFLLFMCSCTHRGIFLKFKMGKLKCFTYAMRTALLAAIICENPYFWENTNTQGLVLTPEQIYSQCQITVSWIKSSRLHAAMHYNKTLRLKIMIHGSMQFISNIILHEEKSYVWFRLL